MIVVAQELTQKLAILLIGLCLQPKEIEKLEIVLQFFKHTFTKLNKYFPTKLIFYSIRLGFLLPKFFLPILNSINNLYLVNIVVYLNFYQSRVLAQLNGLV
jgi:hypothetical protein